MMSNVIFEEEVLKQLKEIKTDVSGLKTDVSGLKTDVSSLHSKFDRLDDRLDNQTDDLKQEIRLQGAYLNQAFDRMNYIHQTKNDFDKKVV